MGVLSLDESTFAKNRYGLLTSRLPANAELSRQRRTTTALLGASRAPDAATERVLGRLSQRHGLATRAHLQILEAALESTALVPASRLVQAYVQVEWLWFTTPWKDFYRDHLGHVLKVTESALRILEKPDLMGGRPLVDVIAAKMADFEWGAPWLRAAARRAGVPESELRNPQFWRAVVLEATRTACLLHDLAYPAQMVGKVGRAARVAEPWVATPEHHDFDVGAALEQWMDRLLAVPFGGGPTARLLPEEARKRMYTMLDTSHSLQAGVRIHQWAAEADRIARLHPTEAFVLEWAALAASLHDYDKAWEKPSKFFGDGFLSQQVRPCFSSDPVSFLVALGDQLQDYGRVSYALDATPETSVLQAVRPVDRVTLTFEDGRARIAYTYATGSDPCTERARAACQKWVKENFDQIYGPKGWLDPAGFVDGFELDGV